MMHWANLLNAACLGLAVLPPVETGAFGVCLGAQVSVEQHFSVRNQTSGALFVDCGCHCYYICGVRPILCQVYKVKKTTSVVFQFYRNAQNMLKK